MIKQVVTSIGNHYDSNAASALSALNTGGLFFQDAPQNVTEPYTVFSWTGSTTNEMMGGQRAKIENGDITFNTFSKADDGGTEALNISEALQAAFDEADLSLTDNFSSLRFGRNGTGPAFFVDEVWQVTNIYTIMVDWSA